MRLDGFVRAATLVGLGVVLGTVFPLGAQEAPGRVAPPRVEVEDPGEEDPGEEVNLEITPREWFGTDTRWVDWSGMTGDWNGWRTRFAQEGIDVNGYYVFDVSKVESGGARRKTTGRSFLDVNVTFDLDHLLALPEARLFIDIQSKTGRNATETVGDFQFFDDIDSGENFHQVSELFYEQWLFDQHLRVKVGKVDANTEFDVTVNNSEFLTTAMDYSPTILVMPTYPNPATSLNVFFYPTSFLSVSGGIYDGATQDGTETGSRGPKTFWDDPSDLFLIGEVGGSWTLLGGLDGRIGIGLWRHTGTFTRFSGGTAGGTDGFYVVIDQTLWRESEKAGEEGQGIFGSFQYGTADRKVQPVKEHVALGVIWRGALPERDDDVFGLGFTRAEFSDQAGSGFSENSEVAYEAFYRLQITPWFALKPDLQYIADPGGNATLSNATVGTIRVELTF